MVSPCLCILEWYLLVYVYLNGISFPVIHFSRTESNSSLSATLNCVFQLPISPDKSKQGLKDFVCTIYQRGDIVCRPNRNFYKLDITVAVYFTISSTKSMCAKKREVSQEPITLFTNTNK